MRNTAKILLIGVGLAIWIALSILFPEPHTEMPSIFFMGLLLFPIIFSSLWGMELAKKHSPHLSGYGTHTSLLQCEPVDSCVVKDPKSGKVWRYNLFLHNGIKLFGTRGGGVHGCSVIREDLTVTLPGEDANVWVWSVPKYFQMDAKPGDQYVDLSCLPREVYEMVVKEKNNFDPRGHCSFYTDPIMDPKEAVKFLEKQNWQSLYEDKNKECLELSKTNDNLVKTVTRLSGASLATAESYGPKERKWYEPRQREEDDRGVDPRQ